MSDHINAPVFLYTRDSQRVRLGTGSTRDIAANIKGRAFWIEAAIDNERLKPAQAKVAAAQERVGRIAFAPWLLDDFATCIQAGGLR